MELPNYSRQLMQQLQALRKECQFCDCTILVEGTPHLAHKVVLSASSLLFKSLLESSDSISIDTAVVSSQEFSSLLDLVYTGSLPPGKHNFTRVIAAADSLQMFDVAVGCKNILNDLVQQQQVQSKDPQLSKEDLQCNTVRREKEEAAEGGVSEGQESCSGDEGASGCPVSENTEITKGGAVELLSLKRAEIHQTLQDIQVWIKVLHTWDTLHTKQQRIVLECFDGDPGVDVVLQRLLDRVKDECDLAQAVLTLLHQFNSLKPDLDAALLDRRGRQLRGTSTAALASSSGDPDKHGSELLDYLNSVNNLSEVLTQTAERCKNEALKEVLLECNGEQSHMQVIKSLLNMLSERKIEENSLLELLQEAGESTIDQKEMEASRTTGEPKPGTSPQAASSEKEDEEEEHKQNSLRKKGVMVSYSCQWCNKSFDFKCRLIRHRKRCALSPGKVQRCSDCPLQFPSLTTLQQHCSQAHGQPPAKKKKTQSVACELCNKTFKHPSGLLYHRRTEHLEERPYICVECGAKFAANSSLKNHVRLHTGEKPYQCTHCDMSFTVAAALSYHTKKKHSEGKMYSCQYCSSTFAQSIELTRHVRTHTGDKPYVCRECGKGFKQANGLSVHLQSFHNVAEPHDCQKCRVSFGSLDELREHIQEVHPKELHQCPECSRILSTAAQLEKHMSVHDGSKPYTCKSCHKSYQTLSGLWYHNRTTHPDVVTAKGSRPLSHLLHCNVCNKTFCNRSSLFKHHITKHPEARSDAEELEEKETTAEAPLWKCVYCPHVVNSAQELQQHVSSEHVSQQGSVFGCVVCSLTFASEAEFEQHFLTTHLQVIQEEEPSQMVIQSQATSEGAEPMEGLDQSQLAGSQQVFVAVGDGGRSAAGSGIVAVNVEDLLTGRIALICEENS